MEVSGQLNTLVVITMGKKPLVHDGLEARWALKAVWNSGIQHFSFAFPMIPGAMPAGA
jgi:hypothetical protein